MSDPREMMERQLRDKAKALDEIRGTAAWGVLLQTLRDIEVGIMREAFEREGPDLNYYRGMREGVLTILSALSSLAAQADELAELDGDGDREVSASDLGITFGGGSLS